jgi:hypothetical protein
LISLRANIVAAFPHITPDMLKVAWEEMAFLLSAFSFHGGGGQHGPFWGLKT